MIVCTKSIDCNVMNNSVRVPGQAALRPEWKENLCLLFVVAVIVAASVLFFLAEASGIRNMSSIEVHRPAATAIASGSER